MVPPLSSFESNAIQINGPTPTILAAIYCPPKTGTDFLNEFPTFLTLLCSISPDIILLGDFNIHIDNTKNVLTRAFVSCLDSFGLQQFTDFLIHSKSHILDLICCSGVTPLHSAALDLPISDHKLVSFNANLTISKTNPPRPISFRNIKNINFSSLSSRQPSQQGQFIHT